MPPSGCFPRPIRLRFEEAHDDIPTGARTRRPGTLLTRTDPSCVLAACLAVAVAAPARADVVTDWNLQVLLWAAAISAPAMVHIAMFDAVNAIDPRYTPYLTLPAPPRGASPQAAAAAAAHGVLVRLFPGQQATLAVALAGSLASVPDGQGETDGVAYGDLVAAAIYGHRIADKTCARPDRRAGPNPGDYQLTGPQPVNTGAPAGCRLR